MGTLGNTWRSTGGSPTLVTEAILARIQPFRATSDRRVSEVRAGHLCCLIPTVYALGLFSGNHINPEVTLDLAVSGTFPCAKVPGCIGAQFVGAIIGAATLPRWTSGPLGSEV